MSYSYIPLYPYATDPLRILARRHPSSPSAGAPPPAEAEPPEEAAESASDDSPCSVDASQNPPRNGERDRTQSGGGGSPPGASSAASPDHHPAGGPPPRAGADVGQFEDTPAPAPEPATTGDGPPDQPPGDAQVVAAWVNQNWDAIKAMARAGEAPERPAPPSEPEPGPAGPPEPPLPVYVAPGDRWNKPKMAEFLRQLAATHSVTAAAKAVGMHRRSAYKLRTRLKGQPFDIAWEAAFRHGYDDLAHAALELALEGEEVPHYYQGELKATHRKRNPQLMVQLLKLRNRAGAPMLGRYGAAAEYWSERWEQMVQRVETGSVTWDDERDALGPEELQRLGVPDAEGEIRLIGLRNLPDEPKGKFGK